MTKKHEHASRVKRIGPSLYQVQRRQPNGKWTWWSPMGFTSEEAAEDERVKIEKFVATAVKNKRR